MPVFPETCSRDAADILRNKFLAGGGGCFALSSGFAHGGLRRAAKAPVAAAILLQGPPQFGDIKIRPEHRREIELGVAALPQQEVAEPLLPASADKQVNIGRGAFEPDRLAQGFIELVAGELPIGVFWPVGESRGGGEDGVAPAVIQRQAQVYAVTGPGKNFGGTDGLLHRSSEAVAASDYPQLHAIAIAIGGF